jgi:hypothetical protein
MKPTKLLQRELKTFFPSKFFDEAVGKWLNGTRWHNYEGRPSAKTGNFKAI